jgi:hypothetical protein
MRATISFALALFFCGAVGVASTLDFTGELHRQTRALLAKPKPPTADSTDLTRFSIVVDWSPFASLDEAAGSEAKIEWHSSKPGDVARQNACTLAFAAQQMHEYVRRMTGSEPPIGRSSGPKIIIAQLSSSALDPYREGLPPGMARDLASTPESFAVIPFQDSVLLIGADRVGALYAVYDFLEKLGVRFLGLGDENEYVPRQTRAHLPAAYLQKPGFGLRSLWGSGENRATEKLLSWMAKNKMNAWGADNLIPGMRKRGLKLFGGQHGVQSQAGIKGNMCLSHPGEVDRFVEAVVKLLENGPYKDLDILEFLPLDLGVRCEEDAKLGSPTDRDLIVVHRLRKAIHAAYAAGGLKRDVEVFAYAYYDTIPPPTRPLPEDFDYQNTSVGFYPMRCFNHALNDPTCNEPFVYYRTRPEPGHAITFPINAQLNEYLRLWTGGKTPYRGRVGFGDYYARARLSQIPLPLMTLMSRDIPYLKSLGVWDVRYMHVSTSDWAMKTLTNYQFAKMLWDPGIDVPALVADYAGTRYGPAAPTMVDFYFHLERAMANIAWVRGDFADRFNRIWQGKETLFIWEHLHLEPFHPAMNDGVDLEESITELKECERLLGDALAGQMPPSMRRRIEEDREWFYYASDTMHVCYFTARAYLAKVAGNMDAARREFAEAERSLARLRATKAPYQIPGVTKRVDPLDATRMKAAYEGLKAELTGSKPDAAPTR